MSGNISQASSQLRGLVRLYTSNSAETLVLITPRYMKLGCSFLTFRFQHRDTRETGSDSQARLVPTSATRQTSHPPLKGDPRAFVLPVPSRPMRPGQKPGPQKKPVSLETSCNEEKKKSKGDHLQLICFENAFKSA